MSIKPSQVFLALALAALSHLPVVQAQSAVNGIAAVVNGKVITKSEVRDSVNAQEQMLRIKHREDQAAYERDMLELRETALDSLIGNFAPRPEKLTIAPGATESLDRVSGDAGGLLNWLDLTLSLRHEGTTETHTLHLVPTGEPGEHAPPNRQR